MYPLTPESHDTSKYHSTSIVKQQSYSSEATRSSVEPEVTGFITEWAHVEVVTIAEFTDLTTVREGIQDYFERERERGRDLRDFIQIQAECEEATNHDDDSKEGSNHQPGRVKPSPGKVQANLLTKVVPE